MANRTPARTLRQCHIAVPKCQVTTSLHNFRNFSTTSARRKHGALPMLSASPTSPPELLDLLQSIQTKIFLPSHLKIPQKRLVYRRKYWNVLRSEPISVNIGSKPYVLETIDRTKDVPDSWGSLMEAMKLMAEDAATWRGCWVNLLKGFWNSGRRWRPRQLERLVKIAGERGMVGCVVDAVRSGEDTGILLSDLRVTREALWSCRLLMVKDEKNKKQALRYAEALAALSEEKAHAGHMHMDGRDPRVQPDCIGVLVELAAACGEEGKTFAYAERMLTNLEKGMGSGMDTTEEELHKEGKVAAAADYELMRWLPAVRGLELAMVLLKDKMPSKQSAKQQLEQLRNKVEDAKDILASSNDPRKADRRGFKCVSSSLAGI